MRGVCYESPWRPAAWHSRYAAIRSSKGVILIKHDLIATLVIGVPTLMIAFAMLVLKIVEVSRSK